MKYLVIVSQINGTMYKLGLIQTKSYETNEIALRKLSRLLIQVGKKETDIVCLPEQWLKKNRLNNLDTEFAPFKRIAREYSMVIIPGAFYKKSFSNWAITAPVIGANGEIIGKQDKIHPFDYEQRLIKAGKKACIFQAKCKFGILICYDMVFPQVANSLVRKGADVLFSPSRIIRRGVQPWHLYVQARALENRVPIIAANIENYRFGGKSLIVDLHEKNGVMIPKLVAKLKGEKAVTKRFDLKKYRKSRKIRFSDSRKFS